MNMMDDTGSREISATRAAYLTLRDMILVGELPAGKKLKIEELRIATNYQVPIFIKMGATRPRFDVAIAAKAGADIIVVDGAEGGTGASPELLLNHTGIPTISAIRAARESLDECGMTGKVSLVAAGAGGPARQGPETGAFRDPRGFALSQSENENLLVIIKPRLSLTN